MSFVAPSSSSHAQASLPTSFAAALRNAAAASKPTPLRTGAQAAPVPVPAAEGQSPRPNSSASASAFDKPAAQAQPHERRCEDCGKKNPKYHERGDATCRQRWCGPCQRRNHPTAIKARTPRECESPLRHFTPSPPGRWRADVARRSPVQQRKDRSSVFRWAATHNPPCCAYWIVTRCPAKRDHPCERLHKCQNCGFVDQHKSFAACPFCPAGWWQQAVPTETKPAKRQASGAGGGPSDAAAGKRQRPHA